MRLAKGCENDIEKISMLTDDSEVPKVKGTNVKVIYSDSAKVKVQILAKSFRQFPDIERAIYGVPRRHGGLFL